jgi:hypothetical protein
MAEDSSLSDDNDTRGWANFWNFNIGHLLILLGMASSAWVVVTHVETTLADHEVRIAHLEIEIRDVNAGQTKISDQLNAIAQQLSNVEGRLMVMLPLRHSDSPAPDDFKTPLNGGG